MDRLRRFLGLQSVGQPKAKVRRVGETSNFRLLHELPPEILPSVSENLPMESLNNLRETDHAMHSRALPPQDPNALPYGTFPMIQNKRLHMMHMLDHKRRVEQANPGNAALREQRETYEAAYTRFVSANHGRNTAMGDPRIRDLPGNPWRDKLKNWRSKQHGDPRLVTF